MYRFISVEHLEELRRLLLATAQEATTLAAAVGRTTRRAGLATPAAVGRLERTSSWGYERRWDLQNRLGLLVRDDVERCATPRDSWLRSMGPDRFRDGLIAGTYLVALMRPPGPGEEGAGVLADELVALRAESRLLREATDVGRVREVYKGTIDLSDDLEADLEVAPLREFLLRRGRGSATEVEALLARLPIEERRVAIETVLEHARRVGHAADAQERTYLRDVLAPVVREVITDREHYLLDPGPGALVEHRRNLDALTVLEGDEELSVTDAALVVVDALLAGGDEAAYVSMPRSTMATVVRTNTTAVADAVGPLVPGLGGVQSARDATLAVTGGDGAAAGAVAVEEVATGIVERTAPAGPHIVAGAAATVALGGLTSRRERLVAAHRSETDAERARRRRTCDD